MSCSFFKLGTNELKLKIIFSFSTAITIMDHVYDFLVNMFVPIRNLRSRTVSASPPTIKLSMANRKGKIRTIRTVCRRTEKGVLVKSYEMWSENTWMFDKGKEQKGRDTPGV